jgi:hypothetical protein
MANFLFPSAKTLMLTGAFNWLTDPISVILVASGQYTPSINHTTLLDVPASARVAVSGILTGRTVVGNVVDADDYLFSFVSGPACQGVLVTVNTGNDATSPLICWLDDAVIGIPYNPVNAPVQIVWSDGPYKIFAL